MLCELNGEMVYPAANFLRGMWMPRNESREKRMPWLWDWHLERLAIQQLLNAKIGRLQRLEILFADS
jgi:hypothetical protein